MAVKNAAEQSKLRVNLAGVPMRTPFGISSVGTLLMEPKRVTPELYAEVLLKHVEAGAGFICLPQTLHVPDKLLDDLKKRAKPLGQTEGPPRRGLMFLKAQTLGLGTDGMYHFAPVVPNAAGTTWVDRFQHETADLIRVLRERKPPDIPLIANVAGLGAFPETYVTGAKACQKAGVDLIELNISCAMPCLVEGAVEDYFEKDFPLYFVGLLIGDQADLAEMIVKEVVKVVDTPVGVKLSPETGWPRIVEVARRVRDAGAKFVNCGNNAVSIAPPDIYNGGKSTWPFTDDNPFVETTGAWLRKVIYKQVAAIAKYAPGIDIVATGGVTAPEHVVEAMMLGATATQSVTVVMYNGRRFIKRTSKFLSDYVEQQGYQSIEDVIGLGVKYIVPGVKMKFRTAGKIFADVDPEKCTGCGRCTDHICLAMYMEDRIARAKVDDCIGCGMCVALCPEEAIKLKTVDGAGIGG